VEYLVVVAATCAAAGALIGSGRRIGAAGGFFVGFLLGPLGVVIALVSAPAGTELPGRLTDRIEQRPAEAGWHPDPLGRFDSRWFDGTRWTQHVGRVDAEGGRHQLEDPV